MIYTEGINKILSVRTYGNISTLIKMATTTGHCAINHNGNIYIKTKDNRWVETPFGIKDFEAK